MGSFLLALAVVVVVVLTSTYGQESISAKAGSSIGLAIVFGSVLVVAAGLMLVFMRGWFVPKYPQLRPISIMFYIMIGLLLVVAFVPYRGDLWRKVLHDTFSYGVVLLTLGQVMLLRFAFSVRPLLSKFLGWIVLLQIVILSLLVLMPSAKAYFWQIETLYFMLFGVAMLSVTYAHKLPQAKSIDSKS